MSEKKPKKKKKGIKKRSKSKKSKDLEEIPNPDLFGGGETNADIKLRKKMKKENSKKNGVRTRKSKMQSLKDEMLAASKMDRSERTASLNAIERSLFREAENGNYQAARFVLVNIRRKKWQPEGTIKAEPRRPKKRPLLKILVDDDKGAEDADDRGTTSEDRDDIRSAED